MGLCTIYPADGHRLEDGQEQQAGSAAGVVIIDLKHVDTTLDRGEKSLYPISELREESWADTLSAHPCTYRCDHYQSYQEADNADKEQQQLPAAAPSDQVGVEVSHWRHQRLQTHKLGDACGIVRRWSMLSEQVMKVAWPCVYACVRASTCVSRPNMMIMMKKQTAQSCGTGIMDTALGKAMKASPGPVRTHQELLVWVHVHKYEPNIMSMPEI